MSEQLASPGSARLSAPLSHSLVTAAGVMSGGGNANRLTRPIFVVGTPFSGARMLAWALARHPNLTHVLETGWLWKLASDLEALYELGTARGNDSRLVGVSVTRSRFYEPFGAAVDDLLLPNRAAPGSPQRWVDGSVEHAAHVAGLLRLFPEARFLHVVRDVNPVVGCLVNWAPPDGPSYTEESACEFWLRMTKALLEAEMAFGSERFIRVRYQELLADPDRALRACLAFLNEPYCDGCARPVTGLADGPGAPTAGGPYEMQTTSPTRYEAELLGRLLLQAPAGLYPPDTKAIERLDAAFSTNSGRQPGQRPRVTRPGGSLVERVQEVAHSVLPSDAKVLVISKGNDELLELNGRWAGHFPQNAHGVYAGFHPATSSEAIAHLEELRARGHTFLLIPSPYLWWLEHYREFAERLHSSYRLVYYHEDTCVIFGLGNSAGGPSERTPGTTRVSRDPKPPVKGPAKKTRGEGRLKGEKPASISGRFPSTATRLAEKLWGGFSAYARCDLEAIYKSCSSPKNERIEAAWELARWHAVQEDFGTALQFLQGTSELDSSKRLSRRNLLLEVRAHLKLGNPREAKSLIWSGLERYGYDADLCMLASNALIEPSAEGNTPIATDDERLDWINRIYTKYGLHPIQKIDAGAPLGIGNITSTATDDAVADGPKVSVIMPAYNAEATIRFALAGLREQTWRNLEILVVDDASTDNTRDIVSAVAAADPRVKLICLEENSGPYVGRNRGLEHATGEYVTVHDADDWSHSQKIQVHLAHVLENDAVGSMSYWVRASRDLRFNGAWRPHGRLSDENVSSLMLRTHLVRELGGWDPVRIGADNELRRRIEAKFGQRLPTIMDQVPLSFALDEQNSLTRQRSIHASTAYFGVRQEYRRAYERWHVAASNSADFRIETDPRAGRKFPAPAPILPVDRQPREYDIVFVSDFWIAGGAFASSYHYILAALRDELCVGIFQWRRYDLKMRPGVDERLARLIDQFKVDMIVADQELRTKHLIFYYPPVLQHRIDHVPAISFEHMYVIVNQMAARLYSGGDPQYDPLIVRENLTSLFGSAGEWFPNSTVVRELMASDPRYPPPGDVTWASLLDTEAWCGREIQWRGAMRSTPVIGRHGRDHYTKWPQTREAIEQAYCVHTGWETRFLGGADEALKTLGGKPESWKLWPFDAVDARDFLDELDFLVHFPHEDYIEEFGRCAMEAMAIGIPVILSRRLAGIYGDAAIYCDPRDVADRIRELWSDERRYLDRARAGREFVLRNCSLDQLSSRLRQ